MITHYTKGVSVIVCCYNSIARIEKTLVALSKQQTKEDTPLEIVLVDNASTDGTAQKATTIWEQLNSAIPFAIVREPSPGLGNARRKGVNAAKYSVILFCDDDNWLAANYAQGVFDILQSDPTIAACGGMGIPVFEIAEPSWFYEYAEAYALGTQEINNENGCLFNLYGAGLAVQKQIVEKLYWSTFQPLLQDRVGNKLSSSGDIEMTYAFVLIGYKLYCTDELKFFHYLSKERLTFSYLKKLFTAFGNDGPIRNLYYSYLTTRPLHKKIRNWYFHFSLSVFRMIKYMIAPPKKFGRVIYLKWSIAYIKQLLASKKHYRAMKQNIARIKDIKKQGDIQDILQKGLHFETYKN